MRLRTSLTFCARLWLNVTNTERGPERSNALEPWRGQKLLTRAVKCCALFPTQCTSNAFLCNADNCLLIKEDSSGETLVSKMHVEGVRWKGVRWRRNEVEQHQGCSAFAPGLVHLPLPGPGMGRAGGGGRIKESFWLQKPLKIESNR